MYTPTLKTLAATLLATASLGAMAAPGDYIQNVYGGASIGTPRYEDGVNGITGHGSGASGKLFGGYQFSPNFALEAGYADLGRIKDANGRASGNSQYLDAVGILPLNDRFSLLGRLGAAHVNLDTTNGDNSSTGLKVGLGAQYALTPKVALRAEWERYQGRAFNSKPNIDQYTVGVKVSF